jgi:negative regulator of replication initiation
MSAGTTRRSVRVDDSLWAAAAANAAERGESVSDVIRRALETYASHAVTDRHAATRRSWARSAR